MPLSSGRKTVFPISKVPSFDGSGTINAAVSFGIVDGTEWDGTTYAPCYTAPWVEYPSASSSSYVPVYGQGTGYPLGFTFGEVLKMYYRTKQWDISIPSINPSGSKSYLDAMTFRAQMGYGYGSQGRLVNWSAPQGGYNCTDGGTPCYTCSDCEGWEYNYLFEMWTELGDTTTGGGTSTTPTGPHIKKEQLLHVGPGAMLSDNSSIFDGLHIGCFREVLGYVLQTSPAGDFTDNCINYFMSVDISLLIGTYKYVPFPPRGGFSTSYMMDTGNKFMSIIKGDDGLYYPLLTFNCFINGFSSVPDPSGDVDNYPPFASVKTNDTSGYGIAPDAVPKFKFMGRDINLYCWFNPDPIEGVPGDFTMDPVKYWEWNGSFDGDTGAPI